MTYRLDAVALTSAVRRAWTLRRLALGLLALLPLLGVPVAAEPVSPAIKLDHFGYRPADAKVAVFTADPGPSVDIRNAQGQVVYSVPLNGGSITAKGQDGAGSLDTVWWVDFSGLATPGTYHLVSATIGGQSYDFDIRSDIHRDALRAALKTFYFQRCNTRKLAAHAGAWADPVACHMSDLQTGPAAGHVDRGLRDLTGGWHDAGDYNKYVWADSGSAVLFLLRAYEENPASFGDDLGIPESGNGVPDVLDEVKWELDWFLKMQLPDGSALSWMHVDGYASDSPPSVDANVRYYRDPNLESTAVFAGSCALGARIYAAAGQTAYAATLKSAALRAWTSLQAQGDSPYKVWAAAEVFRMDGTPSARSYVDGAYNWNGLFLNVENFETHAALTYVQSAGASPAVVANMRTDISNQVNFIFTSDDLYRNGMPQFSYSWGSNRIRAAYGGFLLKAAVLGATGSHTAAECRAHALDFLRFFHGQNALGMLYLTNMAAAGGEHSSWQFYHAWFGDSYSAYSRDNHIGKPPAVVEPAYPYFAGVDNNGVSDDKESILGPAPGFVPGGPNRLYDGDSQPPLGAIGWNRSYRDFCEQRFGNPVTYEVSENSISYQAPYVMLAAAFVPPVVITLPRLSIADAAPVTEAPGATATFTVSLSPASAQTVTVSFSTANGTALAGSDYVALSGTLSFAPGETSKPIAVALLDDSVREPIETFSVTLASPVGADLAVATGTGTILDDDRPTGRDLSGDGKADILWRHVGPGPTTGALFVWLMNGKDVVGTSYLDPISTDWVIQQVDDFNGDGRADILWRNMNPGAPDAGKLYLWLMDGPTVIAGGGYTDSQADFSWQVQAAGDLDGDGKADIVWRNVGPGPSNGALYVWLMSGPTIMGSSYLSPISTDWQIQRVGDFNGDGKADILWRDMNPAAPDAGKLYLWLMSGPTVIAGTGYASRADFDWQVQAIGDLNGDGRQDIVWRNVGPGPATGALYVWLMDGPGVIGSAYLQPISLDWQIQGTADFDGDGRSDLLWRNTNPGAADAGKLFVWIMNGPDVAGGTGYTSEQTNFAWDVKSPR